MKQVNAIMGLLAAGALLFLLMPIVTILPIALSSGVYISYPLPGLSLRWLSQVALHPGWREALANSIFIALGSAMLATLLGTLAAVGLVQAAPRQARALRGLLMLPVAIPSVVLGLGLYFLLARAGLPEDAHARLFEQFQQRHVIDVVVGVEVAPAQRDRNVQSAF